MEISEGSKDISKTEGNEGQAWKRTDKSSISLNDHIKRIRGGRRNEKRGNKSDLEAEETKGFLDLGFVFTEDDLNTELPEIIPGLRKFLCLEEQRKTESSVAPRPYLSEAWDFNSENSSGRTEKDSVVIDFRMAKLCGGEMNMKDSLITIWS